MGIGRKDLVMFCTDNCNLCNSHIYIFSCNTQYEIENRNSRGVTRNPLDNFVKTNCEILPSVSSMREFIQKL